MVGEGKHYKLRMDPTDNDVLKENAGGDPSVSGTTSSTTTGGKRKVLGLGSGVGDEEISSVTSSGGDNSDDPEWLKRKRMLNRNASARFRARRKEKDRELEELRAKKDQLAIENQLLLEQLVLAPKNTAILTEEEIRRIQAETMMWMLRKYRVKVRLTWKAVIMAVGRTMGLYNQVVQQRSQQCSSTSDAEMAVEDLVFDAAFTKYLRDFAYGEDGPPACLDLDVSTPESSYCTF